MRIAVVTLLWRNARYAQPFARSLAAAAEQAGTTVQLIALQNGPDGAEAAKLLEQATVDDDRVELLLERSQANLGFAGGMNLVARPEGADAIVIANLDLEFDAGFVEALRDHEQVVAGRAFLAPSVRVPRRGSTGKVAEAPGHVEEAGALRRDWLHRPSEVRSTPSAGQRIQAGNGSCVVVGRELLEMRGRAVGGVFDKEYHSYYEDVDLFWWAEREHIPIWFIPQLAVIHHQGGSFDGKFRFADRTPDVRASVMANYRLTVWKNAGGVLDVLGWLAGEAGYLGRCIRFGPAEGLRTYLVSWRHAWDRMRAIRKRRGSLRVRPGR